MRFFDQELSAPKSYFEGTCRACSPAETIAWLRPIAREVGVTRVANVTGLDVVGIPVWVAIRPNSKGLATSQGKGLSDAAAIASAMMESVESWHAENIGLPVRNDDFASLARCATAVDPQELNYFSAAPPRHDMPINWLQGFDLISQAPSWVPLECVSTNYVVSVRKTLDTSFVQSSNGLAGGNHLTEAISHALAEVIERHAISAHEASLRSFDPSIRVDPAGIADSDCARLLRILESHGIAYALFDLSEEIALPVYACSIVDAQEGSRWRLLPPFNGYGCHIDPAIALCRAITEAVQSRLTYISGSREDIVWEEYSRGNRAEDLDTFRALIRERSALRPFPSAPMPVSACFEDDVARMIGMLADVGYRQVVAVDLTKPDVGVPVVKIVVPGLSVPQTVIRGRAIHAAADGRTEARARV